MLVASPGSGEPPAAAAAWQASAHSPPVRRLPCRVPCRLLAGLRLSLAPSLPHGVRWFGLVVEHAQQRERAARRCCAAQGDRQL
jgi:hypothetical protein